MRNNSSYSCIVGVLNGSYANSFSYPSGKKARLGKEFIQYADERGVLVFYFSAANVDWKHKSIKGYSFKNNHWVTAHYPFPDIIYNRIPYRSIENRTEIKKLLHKFKSYPGVYLFNTRFLDKWEVYQAITSYPEGAKLVPASRLFSLKQLNDFIKAYPETYLKPLNNSRGKGIIKVKSQSGKQYLYSKAEWSKLNWVKCHSISSLYEQLHALGVYDNQYLMQKAINLAHFKGRIFDLRTQVQKNSTGEWIMTGVGVRVAGRNRIVTHIPNGGSAASYIEVIAATFGHLPNYKHKLDAQLANICQLVPVILEKKLGINLAILSMDIGIDEDGKMLLIEANSKPASFDEDDIRKRHLQYLVDYFIYIKSKIEIKEWE